MAVNPRSASHSQSLPLPGPALLLVNWLLPGMGWLLAGRGKRAASQAVLVGGTFIIGLVLHGGVAWPAWSPSNPEFNLINNFTFLIQLGAGGLALISLIAEHFGNAMLGGVPSHAWYELGSYYLVVAGGINYFATTNLHDRLLASPSRFAEQEAAAEPANEVASAEPKA